MSRKIFASAIVYPVDCEKSSKLLRKFLFKAITILFLPSLTLYLPVKYVLLYITAKHERGNSYLEMIHKKYFDNNN